MKYYIITFGCQMNISDSERIAGFLQEIGYKKAEEKENADLLIITMCSIRQSAVDRVYGQTNKFKDLRKKNPKLKTLLTGCILKKDYKKFKNHFDYILPIKTLKEWEEILKEDSYYYFPDQRDNFFCEEYKGQYLTQKPLYSNEFSASVPISTGCNNFCTFCVVPYTRGPLINRNHEEVLKEIKKLSQEGIKEIWLLGQNVNSYKSENVNFSTLLRKINDIEGDFWIRFTSSHPKDFTEELIRSMKECKKVTEYLNLPVQSGDEEIIKRMNRPYTVKEYKEMVKKIRKSIPNICISTDVIVGFPGETEKQFQNTVKLFKEIKFDMAYISQYSHREKPIIIKDNIPKEEKKRREKVLTGILKETALENNKKHIGNKERILVNKKKGEFSIGKNRFYKTVKVKEKKVGVGQFLNVEITDATHWGLKGKSV